MRAQHPHTDSVPNKIPVGFLSSFSQGTNLHITQSAVTKAVVEDGLSSTPRGREMAAIFGNRNKIVQSSHSKKIIIKDIFLTTVFCVSRKDKRKRSHKKELYRAYGSLVCDLLIALIQINVHTGVL